MQVNGTAENLHSVEESDNFGAEICIDSNKVLKMHCVSNVGFVIGFFVLFYLLCNIPNVLNLQTQNKPTGTQLFSIHSLIVLVDLEIHVKEVTVEKVFNLEVNNIHFTMCPRIELTREKKFSY